MPDDDLSLDWILNCYEFVPKKKNVEFRVGVGKIKSFDENGVNVELLRIISYSRQESKSILRATSSQDFYLIPIKDTWSNDGILTNTTAFEDGAKWAYSNYWLKEGKIIAFTSMKAESKLEINSAVELWDGNSCQFGKRQSIFDPCNNKVQIVVEGSELALTSCSGCGVHLCRIHKNCGKDECRNQNDQYDRLDYPNSVLPNYPN